MQRKSPAMEQARTYYNGNAHALSVLTDEKFFGGKLEDLWEVNDFLSQHQRFHSHHPKRFMVSPHPGPWALEAGARAILLIVRALNDEELNPHADTQMLQAWIASMKFMKSKNSRKPLNTTHAYWV